IQTGLRLEPRRLPNIINRCAIVSSLTEELEGCLQDESTTARTIFLAFCQSHNPVYFHSYISERSDTSSTLRIRRFVKGKTCIQTGLRLEPRRLPNIINRCAIVSSLTEELEGCLQDESTTARTIFLAFCQSHNPVYFHSYISERSDTSSTLRIRRFVKGKT